MYAWLRLKENISSVAPLAFIQTLNILMKLNTNVFVNDNGYSNGDNGWKPVIINDGTKPVITDNTDELQQMKARKKIQIQFGTAEKFHEMLVYVE